MLDGPEHSVSDAAATKPAHRDSRLATALLLALALGVLALGVAARLADVRLQTVLSGSMRPTASPGDVAITQPVPVGSLRVGDVIVFVPPSGGQAVIHRVTSLSNGVITTRGDANAIDDPWRLRLAGPTAYRLVAVVPFLGWLVQLKAPALVAAGLLVGLAVALELIKEVRSRTPSSPSHAHT